MNSDPPPNWVATCLAPEGSGYWWPQTLLWDLQVLGDRGSDPAIEHVAERLSGTSGSKWTLLVSHVPVGLAASSCEMRAANVRPPPSVSQSCQSWPFSRAIPERRRGRSRRPEAHSCQSATGSWLVTIVLRRPAWSSITSSRSAARASVSGWRAKSSRTRTSIRAQAESRRARRPSARARLRPPDWQSPPGGRCGPRGHSLDRHPAMSPQRLIGETGCSSRLPLQGPPRQVGGG